MGCGNRIIVLANRAPFRYEEGPDGRTVRVRSSGGLVTALEPLLESKGGVWVAHAPARDGLPGHVDVTSATGPGYRLRGVPLDDRVHRGFYDGFANEGLWPLCHDLHVEPAFRAEDFAAYRAANASFADAVIEEADGSAPIVLVQDYHFALAPRLIRDRLAASRIVTFWHIPWPRAGVFRRCPWRASLLQGLLASDCVAFQTPEDATHFVDSVASLPGVVVHRDSSTIRYRGQLTRVRAYPVGIAWRHTVPRGVPSVEACREQVFRQLGLDDATRLVVGVDRLDYSKGIEQKFLAVERLLEMQPASRGRLVMAQVADPSRPTVAAYRHLRAQVGFCAARINERFGGAGYQPIVLLERHHSQEEIAALFRAADACVVGSLRDGINLVSKEFVRARTDERGVLVLSRFAGAAQQLESAVLTDPYDIPGSAAALARAVDMPPAEQAARMRALRFMVAAFDADWWGRQILREAVSRDPFARTEAPSRVERVPA